MGEVMKNFTNSRQARR